MYQLLVFSLYRPDYVQVVLSSKDLIVPTTSVLHYLQGKQQQGHSTYEVLLFEGVLFCAAVCYFRLAPLVCSMNRLLC